MQLVTPHTEHYLYKYWGYAALLLQSAANGQVKPETMKPAVLLTCGYQQHAGLKKDILILQVGRPLGCRACELEPLIPESQ